ncbi:MAG: hypothetical protein LBI86_11585 [Treponema sp.]|jgi:hypothetical protein|nr:hypothetical protein [Treponema sp.]
MVAVEPRAGPALLALSEDERRLVEEVDAWLETRYPDDGRLARQRFDCLRSLGLAVSLYPSIRETQYLRGIIRDEDRLVESLFAFSSGSHLLHIPTKVVAVRGFFVAKFHAFSLLAMLCRERGDFFIAIRRVVFSVVCTLMTEEVYISCLEDPSFPREIKANLADDLVSLWDSGTDPRIIRHLPALTALWTARDSAPPSFGTMDGSSELLRITIDMDNDWHDFLLEESTNDECKWALEEFLFGLSYEEIQQVRSRLIRFGISAVDGNEIRAYLGSAPAFSMVRNAEPRDIYDFFVDRRDAACFRKRINAPGPRHTLEELYLKYRILQERK